jgi:hypothetical protein
MQSIAARKIPANQVPIKLSFDAPCSACGDGDTEMKHHNHEPLKAVSQSAERMTPKEFWVSGKRWMTKFEFAEAYAEHCTAALTKRIVELERDAREWEASSCNYRNIAHREQASAESAESSLLSTGEELQHVLNDWNDLVKASGSPTNGAAVGYVAKMRRDAESSAALIEEALEMFGLFGKLMGGELTKVTAWRKAAESLLSDPAVKKVLEK